MPRETPLPGALFQAAFDAAFVGGIVLRAVRDGDRRITDFEYQYLNPAAEKIRAPSEGDVRGQRLLALRPGVRDIGLLDAFCTVVESGDPFRAVVQFAPGLGDGWYRLSAARIASDTIVVYFSDVSDVRREEIARRDSEDRLSLALRAAGLGLWRLDLATGTLMCSEQCRANFGVAPEAPFDYPDLVAAIVPADRAAMQAAMQMAIADHADYVAQYRIRRPDGAERWISAHGRATYDEAGAPYRIDGVTLDITDERLSATERDALVAELEAERARLREAKDAAENANRAKTDFLATMSHELRTPLNAIAGYAELMADGIRGPVTPEQAEDLRRIQRAGTHLMGLINDVLNYTKLEAAQVRFDLAPIAVDDALAAAAAMIEPQARSRGVEFVRISCDTSLTMFADREKALQIVLNLLSNAVKFTRAGGRVTLACAVDGTNGQCGTTGVAHATDSAAASAPPDAGRFIRISVQDTGRGIAEDQLPRVFEPFVQVGRRLTSRDDGAGLGLAISRELARGMGGDLTATSTRGIGSTFTLVLPR